MANVMRYLSPASPAAYRLDPSGNNPVSMGDNLYWSGSTDFFVKRMTANHGPNFVGVAEGVGPTPTSNIDNAANLIENVKVRSHGIHTMIKTTGDSLQHGDPLVIGADAQTVLKQTTEDDSEIIAYVFTPTASALLTGAGIVNTVTRANFPATGILI